MIFLILLDERAIVFENTFLLKFRGSECYISIIGMKTIAAFNKMKGNAFCYMM